MRGVDIQLEAARPDALLPVEDFAVAYKDLAKSKYFTKGDTILSTEHRTVCSRKMSSRFRKTFKVLPGVKLDLTGSRPKRNYRGRLFSVRRFTKGRLSKFINSRHRDYEIVSAFLFPIPITAHPHTHKSSSPQAAPLVFAEAPTGQINKQDGSQNSEDQSFGVLLLNAYKEQTELRN